MITVVKLHTFSFCIRMCGPVFCIQAICGKQLRQDISWVHATYSYLVTLVCLDHSLLVCRLIVLKLVKTQRFVLEFVTK